MRSILRASTVGVALAVGLSSLSLAAADPVADRQQLMKDIAQSMKEASGLNSPATFDAAKAKTVFGKVAADAKKTATLFPAGSTSNGANPKIWENNADFTKRMGELVTLATAASGVTDAAAYGPALKAVGANCKSCHDIYRKTK